MFGATSEKTAVTAREVFERFVSPEVLDAVLKGERPSPAFSPSRLEYVFVVVGGTTPEKVSEQLGLLADLAASHKAIVVGFVCSMAIIDFQQRFQTGDASEARNALVRAIGDQLRHQVKVVHGSAEGHYGSFGSNGRMSYGFVFQQFELVVATLARLKLGEVEELKP